MSEEDEKTKAMVQAVMQPSLDEQSQKRLQAFEKDRLENRRLAAMRLGAWCGLTGAAVGAAAGYFLSLPIGKAIFVGGIIGMAVGRVFYYLNAQKSGASDKSSL
jgi:uncharacterized protein YqgC (DUF456 family)